MRQVLPNNIERWRRELGLLLGGILTIQCFCHIRFSNHWLIKFSMICLSESVEKGNFMTKIFFQIIMLNEVLKVVKNDICWCKKGNVKHQNYKNGWSNLIKFYKKYFQYLKWNIKRVHSIHLILIGIPSSLILFVSKRGWSGGFA